MLGTQPAHMLADNWRSLPLPAVRASLHPRPMLACADGSYVPLVFKSRSSSHAAVYELDNSLCPDIQVTINRINNTTDRACSEKEGFCSNEGNSRGRPIVDYQRRVDSVIDRSLVSQNTSKLRNKDKPPCPSAATTSARYHHHLLRSSESSTRDSKEYCTYWIRTGECDYVQQGCRYKHEMPSLDRLREIGFTKGYPKWWLEKIQRERPPVRLRHDTNAFRKMLTSYFGHDWGNSPDIGERRNSEETEIVSEQLPEAGTPKTRQRVVIQNTTDTLEVGKTEPAAKTTQDPSAPSSGTPQGTRNTGAIDLLGAVEDTDSEGLPPALEAHKKSPQQDPSFRRGRFVPHNESIGKTVGQIQRGSRSPSPLLLDTISSADDSEPSVCSQKTQDDHRTPISTAKRIEELRAELAVLQTRDAATESKLHNYLKDSMRFPQKNRSNVRAVNSRTSQKQEPSGGSRGKNSTRAPVRKGRKKNGAKTFLESEECTERNEKGKQ
ncbi:uncharacterized protein PV09_04915 [Verruconis gallopava]|uniref:C3H1-type domain-containing protein n=1 Tax=Verruconis gallopava TaxID=253628 RepID=A0A0D2AC65_9PEZI|nr:uncharacterized protein PV09_04915 [Verruconis gallopava]KIW04100.1 hypothetical protein PV09_04915 [Verruconis gallopava]